MRFARKEDRSAGEKLEIAASGTHVAEGVAGGAERAVDLFVGVVPNGVAGVNFVDRVLALEVALVVLGHADVTVRVVSGRHVGTQ
jgi:hypothetical protein